MITVSTIVTWIITNLGGVLAGFLAQVINDWYQNYQAQQAQIQTGASTVEAAQAKRAAQVIADMAQTATEHVDIDTAIEQLSKGAA